MQFVDLEMVMTRRTLNWYGHVVRSESEALGGVMSVVAPGKTTLLEAKKDLEKVSGRRFPNFRFERRDCNRS